MASRGSRPVLLDTGILYAYYDRSDAWHARAVRVIDDHPRGLVIPAPVLPEADHLLHYRIGRSARLLLYRSVIEGDYLVADLPVDRFGRVLELNQRFASLDLGFVDAAIVAIAEMMGVRRIATADRRHFAPLARPLSLEILP